MAGPAAKMGHSGAGLGSREGSLPAVACAHPLVPSGAACVPGAAHCGDLVKPQCKGPGTRSRAPKQGAWPFWGESQALTS